MSKSKNKDVFGGFNLIKGNFIPPTENKPGDEPDEADNLDEVIDESTEITDGEVDEGEEELTDKQKENIEKANKQLEKVSKIQAGEADEDENEDEESDSDDDESPIRVFAKALAEKGVLDFDDTDEDFEDNEEGLIKLASKTLQNRASKWANNLDPDFLAFYQYTQAGGNAKDFAKVYWNETTWSDFTIDNEDNQRYAVEQSLRLSGESDEDIKDMIEEWSENGTLEKRATSAVNKLKKYEETEKAKLIEQQKENERKKYEAEQQYWDNFKKEVYSKDELKGFKLNKKQKDELWEFMSAVDRKTGKTGYQKAVENNQDASLLFAYFAMNDFDISKLETQVNTKVSKKLGKTLKNYNNSSRDKMSKGSDYNDFDSKAFEGFKAIR